jgi:hypothetical protein
MRAAAVWDASREATSFMLSKTLGNHPDRRQFTL